MKLLASVLLARIQLCMVFAAIYSSAAISAIGRPLERARSTIAARCVAVCLDPLICKPPFTVKA